jgi:hypothetical protein
MPLKTLRNSIVIILTLMLLITACTPQTPTLMTPTTAQETEVSPTVAAPSETEPAQTESADATSPSPSATPDERLDPEDWQNWPVIPTVSAEARAIYEDGLEKGTDPESFSKVGDCQNITTYFLAAFDDPDLYILGPEYDYLQDTIDQFSGSWSRESASVAGGMNVASVLSPFWADKTICDSNESPLECELRLNQPSIVLISMEESWGSNNKVENYEKYMRQVIETVIDFGALPILATKADNIEGDYAINAANARLAYDYDLPLWNFWRAVQPLPDHGLDEGGFHLTLSPIRIPYDFTDANNMERGWPNRNLTALQVLDAVWRQLNEPSQP